MISDLRDEGEEQGKDCELPLGHSTHCQARRELED